LQQRPVSRLILPEHAPPAARDSLGSSRVPSGAHWNPGGFGMLDQVLKAGETPALPIRPERRRPDSAGAPASRFGRSAGVPPAPIFGDSARRREIHKSGRLRVGRGGVHGKQGGFEVENTGVAVVGLLGQRLEDDGRKLA
jgi:hypothetical protein